MQIIGNHMLSHNNIIIREWLYIQLHLIYNILLVQYLDLNVSDHLYK